MYGWIWWMCIIWPWLFDFVCNTSCYHSYIHHSFLRKGFGWGCVWSSMLIIHMKLVMIHYIYSKSQSSLLSRSRLCWQQVYIVRLGLGWKCYINPRLWTFICLSHIISFLSCYHCLALKAAQQRQQNGGFSIDRGAVLSSFFLYLASTLPCSYHSCLIIRKLFDIKNPNGVDSWI